MFNKIMLFISSYMPLYFLLIIKNIVERITVGGRFVNIISKFKNAVFFDECNDYAIITLLILCIASFIHLYFKLRKTKGDKYYIVKNLTDETSNYYFYYISIYLLSCMGLSLNNIVDSVVLLLLMIVVGIIYVSNNMVYMNPVINFLGYKVYEITIYSLNTCDKDVHSIAIVKNDICLKQGIKIKATGNVKSDKLGIIVIQDVLRVDNNKCK